MPCPHSWGHSSSSCSSCLFLPHRGPPRLPLLPEGPNALLEILPGELLIPYLAGDGAGLLPTEPLHPLDEIHPLFDHATAEKQMKHPGAMLSFELKGGFDAGVSFINKLKMCTN